MKSAGYTARGRRRCRSQIDDSRVTDEQNAAYQADPDERASHLGGGLFVYALDVFGAGAAGADSDPDNMVRLFSFLILGNGEFNGFALFKAAISFPDDIHHSQTA